MRLTLTILYGCLIVSASARARSVKDYFVSDALDSDLTLTACLAVKENRLLQHQGLDEGIMVLPTDNAWTKSTDSCRWFKALMAEENSELRQELILEVGAQIPGEWELFEEMVLAYPYIDAASGNVYYVDIESNPEPELCLAEWVNGDYEASDVCAEMELPPIENPALLGSQYIYKISDVILPEPLRNRLDEAAEEYDCDVNEVPQCDDEDILSVQTSLRK
eukprot:Selendium_serpulae@DN3676_c0_g1_i2.p1